MKNILFFGDSLTAGYGLSNAAADAVPGLIQTMMDREQLNYRAINAGLSGDTTKWGLSRLDYWLSQPVAVFVLELGINDMMRGVTPAMIKINLQQIIDKVKGKYPDVKIALMGMQLPGFLPGARIAGFRELFGELAVTNKVAFLPFYLEGVAGKTHLNLRDGLHPSAEGYKIIANNVWPVIKDLL